MLQEWAAWAGEMAQGDKELTSIEARSSDLVNAT